MFPSQKSGEQGALNGLVGASMGPGCFHPRNPVSTAVTPGSYTLQWGRDVSIPEILHLLTNYEWVVGLQWGRDVSIPEIWWCSPEPQRYASASMGPGCFHPRNSHSSIYSIFKDL